MSGEDVVDEMRAEAEAQRRLERDTRERFEAWRIVFAAALAGTAGTGELIVKLVDRAAKIADEAVPAIMKRQPPDR